MANDYPLLGIISGAPASGRTTVAAFPTRNLRLPLLARDALEERLMNDIGYPSSARSRQRRLSPT